ncbi:MAG: hypothetical protein NUV51_03580 [Sulfuricaulis sp.]|nr:hypothetical protein [Sulfuricaulis sp.]
MSFTAAQLNAWRKYEKVRKLGRFNMYYDPRARGATGLSAERYNFVMDHFSELRTAVEAAEKKP